MANDDLVIKKVGVETDQASFDRLGVAINQKEAQIKALDTATKSLATTTDDYSKRVANALDTVQKFGAYNAASIDTLRQKYVEAADAADKLAQKTSGSGSGGAGGLETIPNERRLGSEISRFSPAVGGAVRDASDVVEIAKHVDQLGEAFQKLPGVLGEVATAGAGVGGTMGALVAVIAPLAIALGVVALAYKGFRDSINQASEALGAATSANNEYYKAIGKGTTDSLKKQLDDAVASKKLIDAQLKQNQDALDNAFKAEVANGEAAGGGPLADFGARLKVAIAGTTPGMQEFTKNLQSLKDQSEKLQGTITGLTQAQGSDVIATNDAAEAEKKLQTARDASADKAISIAKQTAQLETTGTTKSIDDQLAQNKIEQAAIREQIATRNLSISELHKLDDQLFDLQDQAKNLTDTIRPLVVAREAETKTIKDQQAAQDKQVAAVEKYNAAVVTLQEQTEQNKLTINQRYADKVVQVTQTFVDTAKAKLDQLNSRLTDLTTSYVDGQAKAQRAAQEQQLNDQIKFQRTEVDAAEQHLQRLQDIRNSANFREQADLLNRNFLGLLLSKRQTTLDIGKEDTTYARDEAKRKEAFQQQLDDQARQYDFQRQEAAIAYQQQLEQAKLQYRRELALAKAKEEADLQLAVEAHNKELELNVDTQNKKLTTLRDGAIKELTIIGQTEQIKAQIYQASLNQARQLLGQNQLASGPVGGDPRNPHYFADGGTIRAGEIGHVNERGSSGRESVGGYSFPGEGLFMPFRDTNINANKGSGTYTFNIQSHDPVGVRREVLAALESIDR